MASGRELVCDKVTGALLRALNAAAAAAAADDDDDDDDGDDDSWFMKRCCLVLSLMHTGCILLSFPILKKSRKILQEVLICK